MLSKQYIFILLVSSIVCWVTFTPNIYSLTNDVNKTLAFNKPLGEIIPSELITTELKPRPIQNTLEFDTTIGKTYFQFDDTAHQVNVYSDTEPGQSVSYPLEYRGGSVSGIDAKFSDPTKTLILCHGMGLYIIGTAPITFSLVDSEGCLGNFPTFSLSPDQHFIAYASQSRFYDLVRRQIVQPETMRNTTSSWVIYWSPAWSYQLLTSEKDAESMKQCPSGSEISTPYGASMSSIAVNVVVNGITELLLCTAWENTDVVKWLDDDQVLLHGYETSDSAKIEELFVVRLSTRETRSLGFYVRDTLTFFDNNQKVARIVSDPKHSSLCMLNILDLKTLVDNAVEQTFCNQPADITLLPSLNSVLYLNSPIPLGDAETLAPHVHSLNLTSNQITSLSFPNINEIAGTSADKRYIALIADTANSSLRDIYHNLGYQHPQVLIYDLRSNTISYQAPLPSLYDDGILWSPSIDALMLTTGYADGPGMKVVELEPQKRISNFPDALNTSLSWDEGIFLTRSPKWSPNGDKLLLFTPTGLQVIWLGSSYQVITITRELETETGIVNSEWYDNDHLLVELLPKFSTSSPRTFTTHRWVVKVSY